ncbi:MAG: hypothetical protein OEV66_04470 [Spirochaetia bacterium]|nr:hypothetical protein [Spirochaetia bacterium]
MNPTLHPIFVHFPLAVSFIAPMLIVWAMMQYRKNEASANQVWTMVVIPLTIMALFTILAVVTGESGHEVLEKYMDEKPIKAHEELAEVFAMLAYITTGLSYFIFLFKGQRRFLFMIVMLILSLVMMPMAMITGKKGGEVVHKFDAPQYMNKAIKEGALEHIGKHTHHEGNEAEEAHEKK